MAQMTLKGGAKREKRRKKKGFSSGQISSYNRLFVAAFSEADLGDIFDEGGAQSFSNFSETAKGKTTDSLYYDKMFKGRAAAGKAVFNLYVRDENVAIVTIKGRNRLTVAKGVSFVFDGKTRRGGQFLPKSYSGQRARELKGK